MNRRTLVGIFLVLLSFNSFALTVNFDVDGYEGQWFIEGIQKTGNSIEDLAPGVHRISIGNSDSFNIQVENSGNVLVLNTDGVAIGGQNELTFNTQTYSINVNDFIGQIAIGRITSFLAGNQDIKLVSGLNYRITVGSVGSFTAMFNSDGSIDVDNGISAINSSPFNLTLNTVNLDIDPGLFEGQYLVGVRGTQFASGVQNGLRVVPGVTYGIFVGSVGRFDISIDEAGAIDILNGLSGVSTQSNKLVLNTIPFTVDSSDYNGQWLLATRNLQFASGDLLEVQVVPEVEYAIFVGNAGQFRVTPRSDGNVEINNSQAAVSESLNSIRFLTEDIQISPTSDTSIYSLERVENNVSGQIISSLVSGINYRLSSGAESSDFLLSSPCQISESSILLNGESFTLGCFTPEPEPSCQIKQDYLEGAGCLGRVNVSTLEELNAYQTGYGLENGNYKNLRIDFDLSGDIEVHSPCRIRIANEKALEGARICLDGREGVRVGNWSTLSAESITLLSQNQDAQVGIHSQISGGSLKIEAALQARVRRHASINLTGDININSLGSDEKKSRGIIQAYSNVIAQNISLSGFAAAAIRHDSVYNAQSLSINSGLEAVIGFSNQLQFSGDVSLSSSQLNGFSAIRRGASVNSSSLSVLSEGEGRLRRNVSLTIENLLNFSASSCVIKKNVTIVAGATSGNCLE